MKTAANARNQSRSSRGLVGMLAGIEDGAILRFAFFALLAGTASVLYVDYTELTADEGLAVQYAPQPILPPAQPSDGVDGRPMPAITTAPDLLEAPLSIVLAQGGELRLTGTIDPGAAIRFATEIAARGEYVQTVVLDSPGGSVMDALEIGALIHEKALATKIAAGHMCASSCPIIFASGVERRASRDAAIGVHQVYAASLGADAVDALRIAGAAMSDAQKITAEITRHLSLTGVDPALWLHALETPPDRLYYLSPEEMERLKLVTKFEEN